MKGEPGQTSGSALLIPVERIEPSILLLRGQKGNSGPRLGRVLSGGNTRLGAGREAKLGSLSGRFHVPAYPGGIPKLEITVCDLRMGGRRYAPYAFTEQGVAMLSSVLRSRRAVQVNIEIMRAFVRLRRMAASNAELRIRLDDLEKKYDTQFKAIFDAIRALMASPEKPQRKIGFKTSVE